MGALSSSVELPHHCDAYSPPPQPALLAAKESFPIWETSHGISTCPSWALDSIDPFTITAVVGDCLCCILHIPSVFGCIVLVHTKLSSKAAYKKSPKIGLKVSKRINIRFRERGTNLHKIDTWITSRCSITSLSLPKTNLR